MSGDPAQHAVPGDNATNLERRAWLHWAFTVPDGGQVGEVTRYGATSRTPMTIAIVPPDSERPRVVRLEEERDAAKHGTLRLALTRDAGLKAAPITNAKIAGDAYYVLCKLATVVGGSDPRDETLEWLDGYRHEAKRLEVSFAKPDLYATLDRIRGWPYSKRHINLWLNDVERYDTKDPAPQPPLGVDGKGGEWTSITHLATYVRWGRDQPGAIANDALAGRVVELGGGRWKASAWDTTTRQRQTRINMVLVRLPAVDEDPDETSATPDV
jgi:hypothetical protein